MRHQLKILFLLILLAFSYLLLVKLSTTYRKLAISFFVIAPIVLTPYWIASSVYDLFSWLKLYSVLVFLWVTLTLKFSTLIEKHENTIKFLLYLLLQVNIVEAVLMDASKQHFSNVLLGVVLMATLPSWKSITLKANTFLAIHWSPPLHWIIAYTLWNWLFVHFQFSMLAGIHLVLLAGPLIAALFNQRMWIYYRSHSLGVHLVLIFTFPYQQVYFYTDFTWITAQQSMIAEIALSITLILIFIATKSPKVLAYLNKVIPPKN
jgi:hypothetical protein